MFTIPAQISHDKARGFESKLDDDSRPTEGNTLFEIENPSTRTQFATTAGTIQSLRARPCGIQRGLCPAPQTPHC